MQRLRALKILMALVGLLALLALIGCSTGVTFTPITGDGQPPGPTPGQPGTGFPPSPPTGGQPGVGVLQPPPPPTFPD